MAYHALWQPGFRGAVVAPTYADARDTCVEGISGLLNIIPHECVAAWNRSLGELILYNDSRIKLFSADEPNRLRGPQHHRVWGDEVAAWPDDDAFDQIMFGLRLGADPRLVLTTTPKPVALCEKLAARAGDDVCLTQGTTFENAPNLPAALLSELHEKYGNTRLGAQELNGELISTEKTHLWLPDVLSAARVRHVPPLQRVVVGVDPAVTSHRHSDATGIVVAGMGVDGKYYVLEDATQKARPEVWARRVVDVCAKWKTTHVVAETNKGGELVRDLLKTMAPTLMVMDVRAKASKSARAWPVALMYEQGKIYHVGFFPDLENEMLAMTLHGFGAHSPDRVDALVWALSALISTPTQPRLQRL